ncbi:hypothetical protein MNV49_006367 [Pseudohyphozyma bogoriensis]|nr:hypothetical protein MNV49_006367 [Pseudohyphozyma bogoriensis]
MSHEAFTFPNPSAGTGADAGASPYVQVDRSSQISDASTQPTNAQHAELLSRLQSSAALLAAPAEPRPQSPSPLPAASSRRETRDTLPPVAEDPFAPPSNRRTYAESGYYGRGIISWGGPSPPPSPPPVPRESAEPTATSTDKFHYPSRLTAPSPTGSVAVPVDNFAGPRSDSALAYIKMQGTQGWGNGSSDDEHERESLNEINEKETEKRFTLEEDYAFNAKTNKEIPELGVVGGSSPGFTNDGARKKRNKRILWIVLAVVLVIALAVGLGAGISSKNSQKNADESAKTTGAAAAAVSSSSSSSTADAATTSSDAVAAIVSSALAATSSVVAAATTTAAAVAVSTASTSVVATTTSAAAAAAATYAAQTTDFTYAVNGVATVVGLVYTIPTSGVETRTNGQLQWTSEVVLPEATGTGSFTTDLRFRVTVPTAASRMKRSYIGHEQVEEFKKRAAHRAALDAEMKRRAEVNERRAELNGTEF